MDDSIDNNEVNFSIKILSVLRDTMGEKRRGRHDPRFLGKELEYLEDCLIYTYVFLKRPYVGLLEAGLVEFTRAKDAVTVMNG